MFCVKCGKNIDKKEEFCTECGEVNPYRKRSTFRIIFGVILGAGMVTGIFLALNALGAI